MNATLQRFFREAGIAIGLTIAVGLAGYSFFGDKLAEARHDADMSADRLQAALRSQQFAWQVAEVSVKAAQASKIRADSATAAADASDKERQKADSRLQALGQAPDTCKQWVAAATDARDLANETAQHWKEAYDSQLEAAGRLQAAIDTVHSADSTLVSHADSSVKATKQLVKAAHRSFGAKLFGVLKPKINIDAVTFDPRTGAVEAGPKVGLGWSIAL